MKNIGIMIFALLLARVAADEPSTAIPLLNRDKVIAAARDLTTELYPNADDVLIDEYDRVVYRLDGTYQQWSDVALKVLTEKGKRDSRTHSFYYTLPYDTIELKLLEVIKQDGTVHTVDIAANSRVMIDKGQMSANIYNPNSKILQVSLPDLAIGDIVRYISYRNAIKTRVPDTWSDYTVYEYTTPIRHALYEVIGPPELPLRSIALKAEMPGAMTSRVDRTATQVRYIWEVVNPVPRMYSEPSMPELHTVVQRLLVSTIPDWETVSRWYWNLCLSRIEAVNEAMKTKVSELTEGANDDDEKVRRLFRFVSQKIRYMGITIEKEAPGYEPHDVSLTFDNRYGVCRDKAALLVAMLRLAGLKAYPVLIYAGPKKDPEVPQPYFNHAIACVEKADGSYTLMDPTDESTKDLLPAYLCDCSYLVAKPEGASLRTAPILPAAENLLKVNTVGELDVTGRLTAESRFVFEGINDTIYRGYFAHSKPEERDLYFQRKIKDALPGGTCKGIVIEPADIQDVTQPLVVTLQYEADDLFIQGEKQTMFNVPSFGVRVGIVNAILGNTGLDKRKYPFMTKIACGVRETYSLRLIGKVGDVLSLPDSQPIDTPEMTWRSTMNIANETLSGTNAFMLKVVEFSPDTYLDLKQHLKDIEYNQRKKVIFETANLDTTRANMILEDKQVVYCLASTNRWTKKVYERKRILTYAGVKKHSELKASYNPTMEQISLDRAVVISPDGQTTNVISDKEINIMDAGWVGSAPRYPATKILVASLPGVEKGSLIEYEMTRSCSNQPFFHACEYFRSYDPVRAKCVRVIYPLGLSLCTSNTAPDVLKQRELDYCETPAGMAGMAWFVRDQQGVKTEMQLPPWWTVSPALFISAGDWPAYAATVRQTLDRATVDQPDAAAQASQLVDGLKTDHEKVIAIRDFVAANIRRAGPEITMLPLDAVSPADTTLREGYGNQTDTAVVLLAMLRAVGFQAQVMLASDAPRIERLLQPLVEVPQRDTFNSPLVHVRLDSETFVLNDTDQYAELGATPHASWPALMLDSARVAPVRILPEKRDRNELIYDMELTADGHATVKCTQLFFGTRFGSFHKQYKEMPPEERRRQHQKLMVGLSQSAKPAGEFVTDYSTYPGREILPVSIPRFAVKDGDFLYFSLPYGIHDLFGNLTDDRERPYYNENDSIYNIFYNIRLPANARCLLVPGAMTWQGPAGKVIRTVKRESGMIVLHQHAKLRPAVLALDDYRELLELDRSLKHPKANTVLLQLDRQ